MMYLMHPFFEESNPSFVAVTYNHYEQFFWVHMKIDKFSQNYMCPFGAHSNLCGPLAASRRHFHRHGSIKNLDRSARMFELFFYFTSCQNV
jgi:hypothetical protein